MEFEWDPIRNALNIRLRELDFIDAANLFDDPASVTWDDERWDYGESRTNMLARFQGRV